MQLHIVAPERLGAVHRSVGGLGQGDLILAMFRIERDTAAR